MKLLLWLVGLCIASFGWAAEVPQLPETVKLTNGAVLKKISVVRWTADGVVLKHQGGADPIRFAHIDASQRATFEALAKTARKQTAEAQAKGPEMLTYKGQAFIATRGAGSYKLGGMTVYIFPDIAARAFETNMTVELPKPLAKLVTDADGNFSFTLPKDTAFFVFAQGQRLAGRVEELYEWRLASSVLSDPQRVLLETSNHRDTHTRVKIAN
jgi:hypothetical protein